MIEPPLPKNICAISIIIAYIMPLGIVYGKISVMSNAVRIQPSCGWAKFILLAIKRKYPDLKVVGLCHEIALLKIFFRGF